MIQTCKHTSEFKYSGFPTAVNTPFGQNNFEQLGPWLKS